MDFGADGDLVAAVLPGDVEGGVYYEGFVFGGMQCQLSSVSFVGVA